MRIVEKPESISFKVPDNFNEKIEQLYHMVMIMTVDGKTHKNEIALCKLTAMKLGFKPEIIDKMVTDIIYMIAKRMAFDVMKSNLEKKYN